MRALAYMPSIVEQIEDCIRAKGKPMTKGAAAAAEKSRQGQKLVLECLEDFGPQAEADISERTGQGKSTVATHLRRLEEKGVVTFENCRPRKWRIK